MMGDGNRTESVEDLSSAIGNLSTQDADVNGGENTFDILGDECLSTILQYLDILCLVRTESACKRLRSISKDTSDDGVAWDFLDGLIEFGRSGAEPARSRVIRYHIASRLAAKIDQLIWGRWAAPYQPSESDCLLPYLKEDIFDNLDQYEIFVRFGRAPLYPGRGFERQQSWQGFVPDVAKNIRAYESFVESVLTIRFDRNMRGSLAPDRLANHKICASIIAVKRADFSASLVTASYYPRKKTGLLWDMAFGAYPSSNNARTDVRMQTSFSTGAANARIKEITALKAIRRVDTSG